MEVKLKQNEYQYLVQYLLNLNESVKNKVIITVKCGFVYIELDENTASEIREWALEKLPIAGFDKNYELRNEGEILEKIVDSFECA